MATLSKLTIVRYVVTYGEDENQFWITGNLKLSPDPLRAQEHVSKQCANAALWRASRRHELGDSARIIKITRVYSELP